MGHLFFFDILSFELNNKTVKNLTLHILVAIDHAHAIIQQITKVFVSKSYKHKFCEVNKFEDDEVDCIVWASGQPLRSLAKYLFKQKKKVVSPPPPLWQQLYSHINNHWGYFCDIVSLASCTIFFSHYAYSIAILHSLNSTDKVIWQISACWSVWTPIYFLYVKQWRHEVISIPSFPTQIYPRLIFF